MKTRSLILTALFAARTAVGAFLKIPFPLSAITLQFFFTAMAGTLLGKKYGALSQAVYVLLGLVGVPIFAQPGKSAEYAISISGPAERILPQKERIVEHLRNAARELNGFLA